MENRFVNIIKYLEILKNKLYNEEITDPNEKLLMIIQEAILTDKYYRGSIILTKSNDSYIVSTIQKHSYAWDLQGETIDIDKIHMSLNNLEINYSLEPYPIADHLNDYELSFGIPKLNMIKKRTKK